MFRKALRMECLGVSLAAVNIRWRSTGFYMEKVELQARFHENYFSFFKNLLGRISGLRDLVILFNINVNIQTSFPLGAHFSKENPGL